MWKNQKFMSLVLFGQSALYSAVIIVVDSVIPTFS